MDHARGNRFSVGKVLFGLIVLSVLLFLWMYKVVASRTSLAPLSSNQIDTSEGLVVGGNFKAQESVDVAKDLTVHGATSLDGNLTVAKDVTIGGSLTTGYISGDGSGLSNVNALLLNGHSSSYYVNASNLSSGTVDDSLLSDNVALLDADNTFTGTLTVNNNFTSSGNGSFGGTLTVSSLGDTDTSTFLCRNSSSQIAGCPTTGTGAAFVQGGNAFGTAALLGTSDNENLTFRTNGTNWVTITTAGSAVFSGGRQMTINPSLGQLYIRGGTGGWATGMNATNSTDTTLGTFGFLGNVDTLTYYFIGPSYSSPYVTVLNSNGNVGVGTTTPSQRLTVNGGYLLVNNNVSGDTNSGIRIRSQVATTHYNWQIGAQANVGGLEFTPSTALGGTSFTTPSMVILNTGYVGIGDSSPASLFTVGSSDAFQVSLSGNISTTATGTALNLSGAATTGISISGGATTGINISNIGTTTDISLQYGETLDNDTNGVIATNALFQGGFGALATTGTLDWNDSTNSRSGSGVSLLLGNATNGPTSTTNYYHPFNFEYSSKNGTGNITQLAIPYSASASINEGIKLRGKYSGTWSSWVNVLSGNLNGNYGVGTSGTPASLLSVGGTTGNFQVNASGAITASTGITTSGGYTQSGTTANTFTGASTFSASGTGLAVTNNVSVGGAISIGTYGVEKIFTNNTFSNGVSDQKFDLYFSRYWGEMEITLTAGYDFQNATGSISKKFFLGLSPGNLVYTNSSRYTESTGATPTNFAISDVTWDATNSRYRIQIVHRTSTGNALRMRVKGLAATSADATEINTNMAMSSVYTTDTTVFSTPTVSFTNDVSLSGGELLTNGVSRLTNAGALQNITGLSTSGGYTQTGSSANTLSGATSLTGASGNTLVVDTSTFVVDATNNYVGIGTATPGYRLHISQSGQNSTQGFAISEAGADRIKLYNGFNGESNLDFYNSTGIIQQTYSNGGLNIISPRTLSISTTSSNLGNIVLDAGGGGNTLIFKTNATARITVTDTEISYNSNVRGKDVAVSAAASTLAVTFGTAHADASYAVFCTPNWGSTCYVTNKSTTGFTLNFGTAAPGGGGTVDWFTAH